MDLNRTTEMLNQTQWKKDDFFKNNCDKFDLVPIGKSLFVLREIYPDDEWRAKRISLRKVTKKNMR